jgi:hypothetical protein
MSKPRLGSSSGPRNPQEDHEKYLIPSAPAILATESTPTLRKTPLPEEVDVQFAENEGTKHLTKYSGNTVQLVRHDFSLLEAGARYVMETAQQFKERREPLTVEQLLGKNDYVKKWADRKDIQELQESTPGFPDPRKWAVSAMARRLQMPEKTIKRYARNRTAVRSGKPRKK